MMDFTKDISDLGPRLFHPSQAPCPMCGHPKLVVTSTKTRRDRDGDTVVLGWEVHCVFCGKQGELFND